MLWKVAFTSASSAGTPEPAKAGSNSESAAPPSSSAYQTLALCASPCATTPPQSARRSGASRAWASANSSPMRSAVGRPLMTKLRPARFVPVELHAGKAEALADIEIGQPPAGETTGVAVHQPLMEQPVDRLGRDLARRHRMQRVEIDRSRASPRAPARPPPPAPGAPGRPRDRARAARRRSAAASRRR